MTPAPPLLAFEDPLAAVKGCLLASVVGVALWFAGLVALYGAWALIGGK